MSQVFAREKNPRETLVSEIMSNSMIVVGPEVSVEDAVKLMFRKKVKKLPVVEERLGGSRLIWLVTLTDIARVQPKLLETMKKLFAELGRLQEAWKRS